MSSAIVWMDSCCLPSFPSRNGCTMTLGKFCCFAISTIPVKCSIAPCTLPVEKIPIMCRLEPLVRACLMASRNAWWV